MELEIKIELVNAYKRLLEHTLPIRSKNEALTAQVNEAFKAWLNARIEELMGVPRTSATEADVTLTKEEVAFVRALRAAASAKRTTTAPPQVPAAPKRPAPPTPSGADDDGVADEVQRLGHGVLNLLNSLKQ